MRVVTATDAGHPGRSNEDVLATGPTIAVLVDGAGIPGAQALCHHGVAWYAGLLADEVVASVSAVPSDTLVEVLARAIERVTDRHRATCDTADPRSPSAAVAAIRVVEGRLDLLVLGDVTVVVDVVGRTPVVATDRREVDIVATVLPELEAAEAAGDTAGRERLLGDLRSRRNSPGGFWVAKDDAAAARESVTGSLPVEGVRQVALLSNGASRLVDLFGLTDWPGSLALLDADGPGALIARVRAAEVRAGEPTDDATVAVVTDLADR